MATWTENATYHASASLAADGATNDTIDLAASAFDRIRGTVSLVPASRPTSGRVYIQVFPSIDGGTTFSSTPIYEEIVMPAAFTDAPSGVLRTFEVELEAKVRVTVQNRTDVAITYVGKYAGMVLS